MLLVKLMWSDIESNIDFLNYSEASEIIINVLQNPQMLPISIGVFGSWGTGKSTILNLIKNNLERKRPLNPTFSNSLIPR